MAKFKIGEIHTLKNGSKCIIGANGFAYYFNGMIVPIGDSNTVKGYDVEGLTEWIARFVMQVLPSDMLDDVTDDKIKESINWALSEIL